MKVDIMKALTLYSKQTSAKSFSHVSRDKQQSASSSLVIPTLP
jgi:hypothetical protein